MTTYRTKTKIKGRLLNLELPAELEDAEVEVLIIPIQLAQQQAKDRSWLLQFPTWNDEDIKAIEEVAQKFNQWQITEY